MMGRQIPVLRGLAILAVVFHHAAAMGLVAMFWWGHRYGQIGPPPYYDQVGSPTYYGLLMIQQLANFSVPAFLFISGFFIAYAAQGSQPTLSWKVVRTRITNLLWPYLLWSCVIYASELLESKLLGSMEGYSLVEFLKRLALGKVTMAYFFIPLLCQFYLLSPIVARLAKTRSRQLLIVSALIQLAMIGLRYLGIAGIALPDVLHAIGDSDAWVSTWWAFYFPFGVVCGFQSKRIGRWLGRFKWGLFAATVALGVLTILESEVLYRVTGNIGWVSCSSKLSTFLYAVAFILFFLALDRSPTPFAHAIEWVGTKSYGLYLVHPKAMEFIARLVYHIAPWLLAQQILFQPVLVVFAAGVPLLLMATIAKSPAKRFYRYAFG